MKTAMRLKLAREPFEQKIRKVGQLLELSAKLKSPQGADSSTFIERGLRAHKSATRKVFTAEGQLGIDEIR